MLLLAINMYRLRAWLSRVTRLELGGDVQTGKLRTTNYERQGSVVANKTDVLQGTLDLMVLKTLDSMGSQHGYGIAQRLQQVSEDLLKLNQGTLYPALLRLEQRGWITSKWGTSDNNRRARFYSLTRAGKKQLQREADDWNRMAAIMARLLGGAEEIP
jgi:PadR family transcriptional regulator, regulatory protein PadR